MPQRRVNLAAVRRVLAENGGPLAFDDLADRLGVLPGTLRDQLVLAIDEAVGFHVVRDSRGRFVRVRAHTQRNEWSEPPHWNCPGDLSGNCPETLSEN